MLNEYYFYLREIYQIYRLANVINNIQCFVLKNPKINILAEMEQIINIYVKVAHCNQKFLNPQSNIEHCLKICHSLTQINSIPNNLRVFEIVQ